MRELLSSVHTSPSVSRFKIFLIDEVHMLSKGSFNALLKTLEEPPSHVIFLMATTDPEKVPKTVISRCLQLNLKTVSRNNLQEHFRKICEKEGINSDDESEFIETRVDLVCSFKIKSELSLVTALAEWGVVSPNTTFLS